MARVVRVSALLLSLATFAGAAHAQIKPAPAAALAPTVAYVVIERLFVETQAARVAHDAIEREFTERRSVNQALFVRLRQLTERYLDDEATLDEPERTRRRRELRDLEQEAERKEIAYRDDLLHRTSVERDRVAERARAAIAQIARQDKLDVVLYRGVLWARPGIDITDKLIRQLDQ